MLDAGVGQLDLGLPGGKQVGQGPGLVLRPGTSCLILLAPAMAGTAAADVAGDVCVALFWAGSVFDVRAEIRIPAVARMGS